MDKIEINISDDLITGKKRKFKHRLLKILDDLEMVHDCDIIYYEVDGITPTLDFIRDSEILTADQKIRALQTFRNVKVTATTKGVFVDETGERVDPQTEGAIKELLFWQNIPLAAFEGATTVGDIVYGAMQMSMNAMNTRNRL